MTGLRGTTVIESNSLVIFESLAERELHTGTWLSEDLAAELTVARVAPYFASVPDRSTFIANMKFLAREARTKTRRFILHLEAHGAADRSGLALSPSGEVLRWDVFADLCRAVNEVTLNNLVVVLACCHGYHAITQADIRRLTPFCLLVGPTGEVTAGSVQDTFSGFYRTILATQAFDDAIASLPAEFQVFHAERLFLMGFGQYLRDGCVGKGRDRRAEVLLTEYRKRRPGASLREARQRIRALTRPDPAAFHHFRNRYLMADHPANRGRFSVGYDDVVALVRGSVPGRAST